MNAVYTVSVRYSEGPLFRKSVKAAERAKRALAGGSGAKPQVRVRVSVFG